LGFESSIVDSGAHVEGLNADLAHLTIAVVLVLFSHRPVATEGIVVPGRTFDLALAVVGSRVGRCIDLLQPGALGNGLAIRISLP
jgi:hypothetical protein